MKRVQALLCTGTSVFGLLLGGCNAIPGYAEYNAAAHVLALEGIEEYKKYHDDKRDASLLLLCDTSVGALAREPNTNTREFIYWLCSNGQPLPGRFTGIGNLGAGAGSATYMPPRNPVTNPIGATPGIPDSTPGKIVLTPPVPTS